MKFKDFGASVLNKLQAQTGFSGPSQGPVAKDDKEDNEKKSSKTTRVRRATTAIKPNKIANGTQYKTAQGDTYTYKSDSDVWISSDPNRENLSRQDGAKQYNATNPQQRVTFTESIMESAEKNTHMEHVEDEILNKGKAGAEFALSQMMSFADMLKGNSDEKFKVSVKWDGAPAIVAGIDPEDGKFFVSTKAVFNKEQVKMVKTPEDLEQFKEGPRKKLAIAFQHLGKIGLTDVLQGDFMFEPSMLEKETIDGDEMYTFKPNTITYAVPVDNDIGKAVAAAKMGIVFHTKYEGDTLATMKPSFDVDVNNLKRNPDVWFDDAFFKDLTGNVLMTQEETQRVAGELKSAMASYNSIDGAVWQAMQTNEEFVPAFKQYINSRIKEGKLFDKGAKFMQEFITWYTERVQSSIAKLKNQSPEAKAVQARMKLIQDNIDFIKQHANSLASIVEFMNHISNSKQILISKLNNMTNFAHFYKTADGYEAGGPEGYVAIDRVKGAVKIVDRLEFSRRNFAPKNFG